MDYLSCPLFSSRWQQLQISSDFWVSNWSDAAATLANEHTAYRLSVYSGLGLLAALMVFARTLIITVYGIRAARNLFDRMTHSLMHTPMRFFDENLIGRILTRYSGDMAAVYVAIPFMFGTLAANMLSVGCSSATAASFNTLARGFPASGHSCVSMWQLAASTYRRHATTNACPDHSNFSSRSHGAIY